MWYRFSLLFFSMFLGVLHADVKVTLMLESIQAVKYSETNGDELYFSTALYPQHGRSRLVLTPEFPTYWDSKRLQGVQEVPLWKVALRDQETVTAIIALNERDSGPWNVDDQIGTIKVQMQYDGNQLQAMWFEPVAGGFQKLNEGMQPDNVLVWNGDGSHYEVKLHLLTDH